MDLIKKVKKQELEGRVFSKEFKEDLDLLSQVVYELDTKFDGFSSNLSKGETVRDLLQKFNKQLRLFFLIDKCMIKRVFLN